MKSVWVSWSSSGVVTLKMWTFYNGKVKDSGSEESKRLKLTLVDFLLCSCIIFSTGPVSAFLSGVYDSVVSYFGIFLTQIIRDIRLNFS